MTSANRRISGPIMTRRVWQNGWPSLTGRRRRAAAAVLALGLVAPASRTDALAVRLLGVAGSTQGTVEQVTLLPGTRDSYELRTGQVRCHGFDLRPGDYVRLAVDPLGIDVGVRIVGPDDIAIADLGHRQPGLRVVSVIATTSGRHCLETRALERTPTSGRYTVTILELHPAGPHDAARLRAERLSAEAEVLWIEGGPDATSKALERFQLALDAWTSASDDSGQARTTRSLGATYHALGRTDEALGPLLESVRLTRQAADADAECAALAAAARVYLDLGKMDEAARETHQALELARRIPIRACEADALNVLGDVYMFSGRFKESLGQYNEALRISQTLSDRRGQALSTLNLGYTQADLGQVTDAQASYETALTLWEALEDRRGRAATLTALGHLHVGVGENQRALGRYSEARRILEQLGDPIGLARIQTGLGTVHFHLGEGPTAIDHYRRGAELFRAARYPNGEATALLVLGICLSSLARYAEARDEFSSVLTLARSIEDRRLEARALEGLGRASMGLGDLRLALDHYRAARKLAGEIGDRKGEMYAINGVGAVLGRMGEHDAATAHVSEALRIAEAANDRFAMSLAHYHLAEASSVLGDLDRALTEVRESVRLVETLRSDVARLDLRASYLASVRDRHELEIDLLLRLHERNPTMGHEAVAFEVSEQARARAFLDSLAEARSEIREGVAPGLLDREASIRRSLNARAQRLSQIRGEGSNAEEIAALERDIDGLTIAYREVEADIRAESPRYAALMQPKPLTLPETQALVVDDRSVLLQYFLGTRRGYVWAVTPHRVSAHVLPAREEIERLARPYREMLTEPPVPADGQPRDMEPGSAAELSKAILGPVAAYLDSPRLLIVPDGILHFLPFAALPDPRQPLSDPEAVAPLVVEHEVVHLPSASTLALLRRGWKQTRDWPKAVMVFADPVFEADDPRIGGREARTVAPTTRSPSPQQAGPPETLVRALRDVGGLGASGIPRLLEAGREARGIAAQAPAVDVAIGFAANRTAALSAVLADYRIVHFATHGLVDNDHPELSGILLSLFDEQGRAQDGYLRLHDIYNLKLPADLVVLSACSTALGKEVAGEGLVGLVRGFMYAGSRRVLASLWKVDDEATSELMTRFYGAMFREGLTPSAALRAAQLELMRTRRWRRPFYWAAFVLQGDWSK